MEPTQLLQRIYAIILLHITSTHCSWNDYIEAVSKATFQEAADFYLYSNETEPIPVTDRPPFDLLENITCSTSVELPEIPYVPVPTQFPCTPFTLQEPATSVHTLTPNDIKVVGAIGDSLTAANGAGAQMILGCLREYRGLSFSIGGDESYRRGVITLPNILREYNSNLLGFSTGISSRDAEQSYFNVGHPGDIARDIKYQAQRLVDRIKAHKDVDFENDWKIVTILIGGNDLCYYCTDKNLYTAESYIEYIRDALDVLKAELPRTFVNLVSVLKVPEIAKLVKPKCDLVHCGFCRCAKFGDDQDELLQLLSDYQTMTNELIESGRYDTSDDFTVVVQPFLEQTSMPYDENGEPDYSYFAPDCFHFSDKGHRDAAISLWNNMYEPVGTKARDWSPGATITCPDTAKPYFYTYKNSDPYYQFPTQQPISTTTGTTTTASGGDGNSGGNTDCPPDNSEEIILTAVIVSLVTFVVLVVIFTTLAVYCRQVGKKEAIAMQAKSNNLHM
ncbi:phospholipase B1, membrane-associated-like [Ptychodera flava]|uniref:phospholipase B1, membrane-associated-like n=1 Tax=Ptychodera flava TaxID=63121 RepID=UPI00396A1704